MLLELSRAASGKVTLARFLDKVTLPEPALLSSSSILKVRFFGTPCKGRRAEKAEKADLVLRLTCWQNLCQKEL